MLGSYWSKCYIDYPFLKEDEYWLNAFELILTNLVFFVNVNLYYIVIQKTCVCNKKNENKISQSSPLTQETYRNSLSSLSISIALIAIAS